MVNPQIINFLYSFAIFTSTEGILQPFYKDIDFAVNGNNIR